MEVDLDCVDGVLADWGAWVRCGLGRPRVAVVRVFLLAGGGAVGKDFNDVDMAVLDNYIATLGKPTSLFLQAFYSRGYSAEDAAKVGGFRLSQSQAYDLLERAKRALCHRLSNRIV